MSIPRRPRVPARRPANDPLGLLPRDTGWVRRYVLAELLARPRGVRPPPHRGAQPLPFAPADGEAVDHPKL